MILQSHRHAMNNGSQTSIAHEVDSTSNLATKRLVVAVVIICVTPIMLNLLGMDFGTRGPAFDIESAATLTSGERVNAMFHSLEGSYTHTILEWSAFCTAIFTVVLAFVVFHIKGDITTPIIAMALFWAGGMDAFHTLAADRLIESTADPRNLIPFTWAICRAFNALIVLTGVVIILFRSKKSGKKQSILLLAGLSIAFGLAAYSVIHYCAVSENLPNTMFPDAVITRPWDVIALILFLIDGFFLWLLYKRIGGAFAMALLVSTIADLATQLHMSLGSTALFDNHFNIAHFLKIITYLIPFTGLMLDYILTYRHQQYFVQQLEIEINERKRAEQAIDKVNANLTTTNLELQRFNRLMIGREKRVIDLKKQVNDMSQDFGKSPPYPLSFGSEDINTTTFDLSSD